MKTTWYWTRANPCSQTAPLLEESGSKWVRDLQAVWRVWQCWLLTILKSSSGQQMWTLEGQRCGVCVGGVVQKSRDSCCDSAALSSPLLCPRTWHWTQWQTNHLNFWFFLSLSLSVVNTDQERLSFQNCVTADKLPNGLRSKKSTWQRALQLPSALRGQRGDKGTIVPLNSG